MQATKNYKFWFCTGSQDLYGDECLRKVAEHSAKMVEGLNKKGILPFEIVLKPTLISQASIRQTFNEANNDPCDNTCTIWIIICFIKCLSDRSLRNKSWL